ncbi:hypothetical protein [Streptomyces leeuwenhoekii]|uniref:hypothetical protein n=1 Tax=Streptomyces leeuwenhoekii TaxID=1437453 RepID=UPI00065C9A71|nr:hypothetical protein [Streptomyces leeuwenhoekii]
MKTRKIGAALTVALAALAYAGAPAAADGHVQRSDGSARVTFYSTGEKLKVCDGRKDGHSAVARLYRSDTGKTYSVWRRAGVGCSTFNYSMPEGTNVKYRACLGNWNNKTYWGCSVRVDDEA